MSEQELWNELGNLYFMSGAYPQAVQAYNRSIQLDSSFGRPYSNLALTYVQQGKYDEAVELYRRSIELLVDDKEKAISWSRLGNVYRHLKDYRQAVIAYQKADELDTNISEAHEEPGHVLNTASDQPAVEDSMLNEMITEIPEQETAAQPYLEEEQSLLWSQVESATVTCEDPIADMPVNLVTLESASDVNQDLDAESGEEEFIFTSPVAEDSEEVPSITGAIGLKESQPVFENVQELDLQPAIDPAANHWRAELKDQAFQPLAKTGHSKMGDYSKTAVKKVDVNVDEADPASAFMVANEADESLHSNPLEAEAGKRADPLKSNPSDLEGIEEELAKLNRMVQVNPRNGSAWDTLGNCYKSKGLYKEAIAAYLQATSVEPRKALYFHHLGLVYAAEGREEDAIKTFQKVIELDSSYSLAHASLGGYYRKMGLEELAKRHIGKAMKIIYDSENDYNRACLEAINGHVDQALGLLRVALENKQTYVNWVLHDPDLDFIRSDPRFKQLISEYSS